MRRIASPSAVGPFLCALFLQEDGTPFASQAASMQVNTMGQAKIDPDSSAKQTLTKVEELLHQLLAGEQGGQGLGKIVSKFLVDVAPFMK